MKSRDIGPWSNAPAATRRARPLIYINDQRLYPLSLGLFELRTSPRGTDYGMLMAASTLMTIPVMLLFFAGQRYFIEGVTLTGMKA